MIVIAAWDLGQNSAGVSGGRATILNRGGANRGAGGRWGALASHFFAK